MKALTNQRHLLDLVAEPVRYFISSPRKEALVKRKADGIKWSRSEGSAKKLHLDAHAKQIDDYLANAIDKLAIFNLLDVCSQFCTGLNTHNPIHFSV